MNAKSWIYLPNSESYFDMSKIILVKNIKELRDKGQPCKVIRLWVSDDDKYFQFTHDDVDVILKYISERRDDR